LVLPCSGLSGSTEYLAYQASYNKIPDLKALDTQLRGTTTLKTIYLEGNPCQTNDAAGYRRKTILALPQVTQIDAT
jgi:protein phosphatase 1 regulatory subunit 7